MHRSIPAEHIVVHLALIDGVGPQTCSQLCRLFADDMQQLYAMNAHELQQHTSLSRALCQVIVTALADKALLDNELARVEQYQLSFVTILSPEYPELLRHIHAPPPVLYYQGALLNILWPAVAFVGSRKGDTYGQQVLNMLIPPMVKEGFTTISGGALGIDGMVHRATLKASGKTVAVLGSGLLRPYPAAHRGLFQDIVARGGLVMSSFPLTFEPLPGNFPARNRIIAGLSLATVVIQAAIKSGALLTARNALDEGRDVGVVPGSIFNELSAGCHELLVHGARSITCPEDIFELLGHQGRPATRSATLVTSEIQTSKVKEVPTEPLLALCTTPKSSDELLVLSGYSCDMLQERLWQLQVEGRLEQNMLGMWRSLE